MAGGWGGEKGAQVNGSISPRTDAPFSQRQKGAAHCIHRWECEFGVEM